MRRRFAVLSGTLLMLGAAVLAPAAANAATYPPAPGSVVKVATTTPIAGELFKLELANFRANTLIQIKIRLLSDGGTTSLRAPDASLGTSRGAAMLVPAACSTGCEVTAGSDGTASVDLTLTEPGETEITASGTGADGEPLTETVTVTVVAAADGDDEGTDDGADDPAGSGSTLATTGADILKFGAIGLGLLALGSLLVIGVRRRSSGTPA